MRLKDLAGIVGGYVIGNPDADITEVSGIKDARQGSITFLADKKNQKYALGTHASAILAKEEIKGIQASIVIVDNPYLAFAKTLEVF
ncbi:MAG: UDP-3-O-(3-hydroxymyristoyl)glucosamine N-acyltransferase, partial [Nitrospirae bacterium]|nr:UDP-3-O-(3-hydroxymyristoyl)glucosamine N-acyltransferase [Nitrospirota bacterium]